MHVLGLVRTTHLRGGHREPGPAGVGLELRIRAHEPDQARSGHGEQLFHARQRRAGRQPLHERLEPAGDIPPPGGIGEPLLRHQLLHQQPRGMQGPDGHHERGVLAGRGLGADPLQETSDLPLVILARVVHPALERAGQGPDVQERHARGIHVEQLLCLVRRDRFAAPGRLQEPDEGGQELGGRARATEDLRPVVHQGVVVRAHHVTVDQRPQVHHEVERTVLGLQRLHHLRHQVLQGHRMGYERIQLGLRQVADAPP
ncbi:hypothetical protein ACFFX0_22625 [Citricoccus parietis]|uniref:Uncharacterized protein n=1 Tax=Citricoccus parietis TaxID=592307 RepID=A0ABV5G4I1_9MICC